ncbi:MAG: alpha/beta fold hydrolase [Candidatus Sulfotelmatobacter sp.]
MSKVAAIPVTTKAPTWTRTRVFSVLWSGWAASVCVVLLAVIAVEAAPHVRGIGFFPQLRYVIVTPVCGLTAVGAAFLYRFLVGRSERPRMLLVAVLLCLALIVLLAIAALGPAGLTKAAFPALFSVAIAVALLVPRLVDQPRRSLFGTIAIVIFGLLELVGFAGALSTEGVASGGPAGPPFDIPHTIFDVDQKFIDLPNGTHIHYVDEGHGETLLFLHGNPSWLFQWRDLITGLRGSHRCVALDYPGFGMSTAPAGFGYTPLEESRVVEEFVDRLGLHNVTLVMQDWGGPIGLGLAERRPELVRRVILGSTWAWQTSRSEPRGKFSIVFGGPIGEFIQMNFPGIVSFGLKHNVVRQLPPDVIALYLRPFLPPNRRGIAAFYPGQITAVTDYFARLDAGLPPLADKKALIFWALQDPGFSRNDLARWERNFPDHKTIEFPNASHFFFEDEADQMIPAIRAFMSADQTGLGTASKDRQ